MTPIEWSALLGNVGEFVGSVAVLATLVYLAVQVRHSRELLLRSDSVARSEVYQARTALRMDVLKFLAVGEANALMHRWQAGAAGEDLASLVSSYDALSPREQQQLTLIHRIGLNTVDNSLYQHRLGLLDDEQEREVLGVLVESYPLWKHMRIPVPEHLERRYRERMSQPTDEANC